MNRWQLAIGTLTLAAFAVSFSAAAQTQTRYFSLITSGPALDPNDPVAEQKSTYAPHEFIFAVNDPALISQIEAILDNTYIGRSVHVMGLIEKNRADYNQEWPFHLVPESIQLFSNATEQCDATTFTVEDNLALVGVPNAGFLDDGIWCPWSSRLVREVKYTPPTVPQRRSTR